MFDEEKKSAMFWVCFLGSKLQAKEYNYIFEVRVLESKDKGLGGDPVQTQCGPVRVLYEGPVRYIDENNSDIFKSQFGLNFPYNIIQSISSHCKPYKAKNIVWSILCMQFSFSEQHSLSVTSSSLSAVICRCHSNCLHTFFIKCCFTLFTIIGGFTLKILRWRSKQNH